MTDIIVFPQTKEIKIWLEIRVKIVLPVHTDLILICVDHICICVIYGFYDFIKSIRLQCHHDHRT